MPKGFGLSSAVERSLVEVIDARADSMGLKKGEFAALVWPESSPKVASSRWAAIRCSAFNTGKPQSVTVSDAHRMAAILGEDLSYLIVLASEMAKNIKYT